ncbi:MAG: glycosyltransferase [Desulfomonile tiedjei]|uniref:Glycosyltransferase n=1 Tax=Desulfomonile tiedjei TaxID=2358 RepID=A0A9D6V530_9BACT|nr:glycosyltransferase [Desulfomonile tiedjei]
MRILHLLHRSVPGTHGYAIRSREIVKSQLSKGLEPIVITSPSQAPLGKLDSEGSEFIDGIRYFRTCGTVLKPSMEVSDASPVRSAMRVVQNGLLMKTALQVARKYNPAVIHAHSPFTCGIIGNLLGVITKTPSVYEIRGIWEDSHVGRYGLSEQSLRYRGVRTLENLALKGADFCCVICEALRAEVISRGVPAEKTAIVPNGVDLKEFTPGPPDEELRKKLGLDGCTVAGYIGSFFHYEGLDLLVQALTLLAADYPMLRLLLVGDGELMPVLRQMAAERGISQRIVFTGRVAHTEVAAFYRIYDFMVLPRRNTRETRLVTPLKPMEIMAMQKPLIVSDIGGHREIVEDGANGIMFESENAEDLAAKCRTLLDQGEFRRELGLRGYDWVVAQRNWDVLVDRYIEIYRRLT